MVVSSGLTTQEWLVAASGRRHRLVFELDQLVADIGGGVCIESYAISMGAPGVPSCTLASPTPTGATLIADWEQEAARHVAMYRATMTVHLDDPAWTALPARLAQLSPDFARFWAGSDVAGPERRLKRFRHRVSPAGGHVDGPPRDPWGLISRYVGSLVPGSYLALTHLTDDHKPPHAVSEFCRAFDSATEQIHFRSRAEVERFFAGLDLVSPHEPDVTGCLCYAGDWGRKTRCGPTATARGGSTAGWAGATDGAPAIGCAEPPGHTDTAPG
jgi:hypothetical protein